MPMAYVLREAEMPILPAGHDDIRVLHFSDLHLTPARKKEIADIKSFISLKPDLVISTGDFLAHKSAVPVVLNALDALLDLPAYLYLALMITTNLFQRIRLSIFCQITGNVCMVRNCLGKN